MTEQDEALPSGARATRPPLRHADLEDGRPHKIIIKRERDQSEEASQSEYRNNRLRRL